MLDMNWWIFNRNEAEQAAKNELLRDKQLLIQEIRQAHLNWVSAQSQFEVALDKDQVDYAIFTLEATEKRYEMLLKQAKKLKISLIDSDRLMEVAR
ncbi:hypothetical protein D3C73_463720 [compost metagenome]